MRERFALDFDWRGFELHPEIPPGGVDIARMFAGPQVEAMNARLEEMADKLGVPFTPPRRAPSTKKALALSEHARREGRLDEFRQLAMDAFWRDGRDLEDDDVLREVASGAGLEGDRALAFLDDEEVPGILQAQRREAAAWGVTGIPTWFMLPTGWQPGDELPPEDQPRPVQVVGCQPLELVEQAAEMAGAERR